MPEARKAASQGARMGHHCPRDRCYEQAILAAVAAATLVMFSELALCCSM